MAEANRSQNLQPPNGGWGWMVVLGVALTNTFNQSLLSIYGLVFGEKLAQMGENTVGAALVGNLMLLVCNFSGLISGPALKRFSPRRVSIIASFISSIGMIMASYATKRWHLIVSYSVFTGLGIGLLQSSTFLAIDAYFTTKRGRAVGVAMAGTGFGQMIMPHLVRILLDTFDYRGATQILGGLALNGVIGAALFHPVEQHSIGVDSEKRRLIDDRNNRGSLKDDPVVRVQACFSGNASSEPLKLDDPLEQVTTVNNYVDYEEVIANERSSVGCMERVKRFFDLDLLLDFTFVNIVIGCSLGFTSNQNFNMLFPFFLQRELGMTRSQTATCMSTLSAFDIVARLTIPVFAEKCNIPSRISFYMGCLALTIARTTLSLQDEYFYLLTSSAFTGFFRSCIVINQNLAVSEHYEKGDPKLATALGINMVIKGMVVISVGQVLGWVRDYYGSYVICFFAQNVLLLIVFVMWSFEYMYLSCCRTKK